MAFRNLRLMGALQQVKPYFEVLCFREEISFLQLLAKLWTQTTQKPELDANFRTYKMNERSSKFIASANFDNEKFILYRQLTVLTFRQSKL